MFQYDNELKELKQKLVRKAHFEAMQEDLNQQWLELSGKAYELKTVMYNEQADVDQLEGRSLAAFFYNVIGKKDEKLDKERREAYAARVKYDAAARELQMVDSELARCREELERMRVYEKRFSELLEEKTKTLRSNNRDASEKIFSKEQVLGDLDSRILEIREAQTAGKKALCCADRVMARLNEAEEYGTWDLIGGGLIAGLAKHESLDEAQEEVESLQVELRRFKTELTDVSIDADLRVNMEGSLKFADFFFDGIFTDWSVQETIKDSQSRVNKVMDQIKGVLVRLDVMLEQTLAERDAKQDEFESLIISM